MKRILMAMAAALCCMTIWAQPISEQQAKERALQYLRSDKSSATARRLAPAKSKLKAAPVEATSIYAFNVEGGGYIIASADSRTLPVLGYSTTGSIDWEEMPENMRSWLKQYDEAMATLGNCNDFVDGNAIGPRRTITHTDWKAVEPFIKTHWSQAEPYYNQCPIYQGADQSLVGRRSVTGCAATALAQVMNYYQWPKSLPDGLPDYVYYTESGNSKKAWHIDALPPVTFDWDNMLNDYGVKNPENGETEVVGTDAQKQAVATLMRYCGQAVEMKYGPNGSAAYYSMVQPAFVNYLDYPAAVFLADRSRFTVDEWDSIMYAEIAAKRPVLIAGQNMDGGHFFICDGYDGEGMFHINWGWGGKRDGYFALAVLNPYTSTGYYSNNYGYCLQNSAIIYTDPKMEKRPVPKGSYEDLRQMRGILVNEVNKVEFCYQYYADEDIIADNALGTIGEDGTLTPLFFADPNDSILYHEWPGAFNNNYFDVEVDSDAFQPGEILKLYPMVRFRQADAQWQTIPPLSSFVVAGRTAEGEFFCYATQIYPISVIGDPVISKGTGDFNTTTEVTFTVCNNSEQDFTDCIWVCPVYYGHFSLDEITEETPYYYGDWICCGANIPVGDTATVILEFVPQQCGVTVFHVATDIYDLGFPMLILPFDTLVNYDAYVDNNSYFTREGDQWYYNIELCDKPGVRVPYWVPSDSIGCQIRWFIGDDLISEIFLRDEIKEYLTHLPEYAGKGEYKFNYQMPIDISKPGAYWLQSYVGTWNDGEMSNPSCAHVYEFLIETPSGITPTTATTESGTYYDLTGRKVVNGKSVNGILQRGIYIVGGKKVFVK